MNDRQHICAYVKLLGIYISVDYSWDRHQKCQRTAIMISAIQFAIALCLQSSCHYSAFLSHIQFRLHVRLYTNLGEAQTHKFGSLNLFTAKRSCRLQSFLSYHAKLSIAGVAYYRVDLESLHLCYLPIDSCIYWMVVVQLEPITINSIVNSIFVTSFIH